MRNPHIQAKAATATSSSLQTLRQRAEACLLLNPPDTLAPGDAWSATNARGLIHELLVHQIELEMQNEELRATQTELTAAKAHYFDLFDLAPVGYVTLNAHGLLLQTNLTAATLLGVARQDLPMRPISNFILRSDQGTYYHHRIRLLASGQAQEFELRLLRAGAAPFWAQLTLTSEQEMGGAPMLRLMISDIARRKAAEDKLRVSDAALSAVSQGVLIAGVDGLILSSNEAFGIITGYSQAETVGRDCKFLQGPQSSPASIKAMRLAIRDGVEFAGEILNYRKDGSTFWNELSITPLRNPLDQVTHFFSVTRDITARHQLENKVHQMAFYDELTQLPNRRLINDRLTHTMATSKRSGSFCALMLLDLDNFKALNDVCGHLVGDLLLIEVARRLSTCVREVDTVGRFGGDEFVVTLGELSANRAASTVQAAIIAEKVRKSLAEPYLLAVSHPGHVDTMVEHRCSASIGVLVFTDNYISQNDILLRADTAMYQAKHDGRNRVQVYQDI